MTEWDKVDLLTCFESEPEVGDDALSYRYCTERSGYRLSFTIYPYDEDIIIVLHGPSQLLPLFEVWLHSCTVVRYEKSGEVESLGFKYRDLERGQPQKFHACVLQVRPEFSLDISR